MDDSQTRFIKQGLLDFWRSIRAVLESRHQLLLNEISNRLYITVLRQLQVLGDEWLSDLSSSVCLDVVEC